MGAFRRGLGWMASARILILAATLALAGGALVPGRGHAYCRLTTEMPLPGDTCAEAGAGLVWDRPCISFSMTARRQTQPLLDDVRDVADTSFDTWLEVTCDGQPVGLSIRQTAALGQCSNPEYNVNAANANTVIFVSDWAARKLPEEAFGLTLVWHNPDTGEIHDADMQINETLGTLSICNGTCAAGRVDLQNVFTHEAGHFLGLGHSDDTRATMAARAQVGETRKRDLADDDRAGLCAIYGKVAAASCSGSDYDPDRGFAPQCMPPSIERPQTSGCSVQRTGAGTSTGLGLFALLALCAGILLRRRRLVRQAHVG